MSSEVRKQYMNQRFAGAFSGIGRFIQNRNLKLTRKEIEDELLKIKTYAIHKGVKRKFRRRRVKVLPFLFNTLAVDLKDISSAAKENRGYKWILVAVCIFSKKLFTRLLKDKSANSVLKAFQSIFKQTGFPSYIWADRGREWYNVKVMNYFRENGVRLYSTHSPIKSTMAERAILSLFLKLQKYMYARETLKIHDKLQEFTDLYNKEIHKKLGVSPNDVTPENAIDLWLKVYAPTYGIPPKKKPRYSVGQLVRLAVQKRLFSKGYSEKFSEELYRIRAVDTSEDPVVYFVETLDNQRVDGMLYESELSRAVEDSK